MGMVAILWMSPTEYLCGFINSIYSPLWILLLLINEFLHEASSGRETDKNVECEAFL